MIREEFDEKLVYSSVKYRSWKNDNVLNNNSNLRFNNFYGEVENLSFLR